MASKKLIVVFGATGAQGGSVARALVKDNQYKVRGVTRNTTSAKAKELEKIGIEPIKADLADAGSVKNAMQGAYGVFLVTDYWSHMIEERETREGKQAVDAAKDAGVQHLIYSGLENAKAVTGIPCPHFDCKSLVTDYIKKTGIGFTIVKYAGYFENHLTMQAPKKNADGIYELALPMGDVPLDLICTSETGECVHQIFNKPGEFKGQEIGFASDRKTIAEYAEDLNRVFKDEGRKFKASPVTTDQFRQQGDPMSVDLAAMFDYYKSGKCIRDVAKTRELNPDIPTYEQWARKNKAAFIKAMDAQG